MQVHTSFFCIFLFSVCCLSVVLCHRRIVFSLYGISQSLCFFLSLGDVYAELGETCYNIQLSRIT